MMTNILFEILSYLPFFLLFNSNQTTQKYLNSEVKSQKLQLNSEDMMSM